MPRKKVGRKIDVNGTLQDLGNTLSDADLEKFDTIERNAQKNVQADWNETDTSSSSYIRNKPSYDSWILGEFEKTSNLYFTPINSNSINLDFINNDLYRAGKLEDSYTMSMTLGKKYTLSFDAYLLDYADASTLWANVKLDNISIQKQGVSSGYYKLNTQNYTIGIGASNYTHISFTFTAPINVEDVTTSSLYFGFNKYSGSNIVGYPDKGLIVYIKNVMLNEGETALSYSIPFGQLLWTRDVVGVYAKEEDVPDESKLGTQLSLALNSSNYKLTAKLLNSSNVVLSSKEVDLPLEEMVVDASYNSTTKEITLELKNGNTTSFSVADLVSGLVPTTRKINGKALSTDISLTASDVGALPSSTTIPTVNNGKLTIKRNNTEVGSFTANQSSNTSINIEVPTDYATKEEGVFFVQGLTTTTAGIWEGTNSRITSYYDGLTINFKVGVAGGDSTNGTTLNINGLGAKPCYLRGTTKIATHYAVGTMVILSYNATTDAFYSGDYDANNYAYARQYGNITTNAEYPVLFSQNKTVPETYANRYTSSQEGFTYNPSTKTFTVPNIKGTTIYENGTALSSKYLGINATASNSTKLNNQDASYYLDYNNFTNKPTIPTVGTAASKGVVTTVDTSANLPTSNAVKTFVEGKGYVTSSGSVESATRATQDKNGNDITRIYCSMIPAGTAIGANSNLNTVEFLKVGNYYCSLDATASTLVNYPDSFAFMMQVYSPLSTTIDNETTGGWVYRIRKILTYQGAEYIQVVNSGSTAGSFSYGAWKKIAKTSDIPSTDGFVKTTGAQTVGGTKTFSDGINLGSQTKNGAMSDSIALNGAVLTSPNLNEITNRGIYHCSGGTNVPSFDYTNSQYDLLVFNSSEYDSSGAGSALVTQLVNVGWKWWIRQYGNSTWGAWERFAKTINVDSSLSSTSTNPVQNKVVQAAIAALQSNSGLTTSDLLSKVYPVGSIYMSINNTSPASFLGGSWTQIGAGYALWTASSGAGGTISAGLPNITGSDSSSFFSGGQDATTGSGAVRMTKSSNRQYKTDGTSSNRWAELSFNANWSNSIYGASTTVQPPAYKVYAWRRTA